MRGCERGEPTHRIHPLAADVLAGRGVDIVAQRAKSVGALPGKELDLVVTLCGDDVPGSCPFFQGAKRWEHVPFPDSGTWGDEEETWKAFCQVSNALWDWLGARFVKGRGRT